MPTGFFAGFARRTESAHAAALYTHLYPRALRRVPSMRPPGPGFVPAQRPRAARLARPAFPRLFPRPRPGARLCCLIFYTLPPPRSCPPAHPSGSPARAPTAPRP